MNELKDKKLLTLDEKKKIMFNILLNFKDFCDKNNLKFYLIFGTLLGAVRHQGFIPWDDDIDVTMPRKDYEKLISLMKDNNKINDHIIFSSFEVDGNIWPFGKVYDTNTVAKTYDEPGLHHIWIDVFPLDNVSKSNKELNQGKRLRSIMIAKLCQKNVNSRFRFVIKMIIKCLLCFIPIRHYTKKVIKISKKYMNENTPDVGFIDWGAGAKERFLRSDFEGNTTLPFEGVMMPVPKEYDKLLKQSYGNYMELPPENKRVIHGFDAWMKEE